MPFLQLRNQNQDGLEQRRLNNVGKCLEAMDTLI